MRNVIYNKCEQFPQITFVTTEGEEDDITKAKFQSGDKVVASDEYIKSGKAFDGIATIDIAFISLVYGELKYAVIGYKDDGSKWIDFCNESQLKRVANEYI